MAVLAEVLEQGGAGALLAEGAADAGELALLLVGVEAFDVDLLDARRRALKEAAVLPEDFLSVVAGNAAETLVDVDQGQVVDLGVGKDDAVVGGLDGLDKDLQPGIDAAEVNVLEDEAFFGEQVGAISLIHRETIRRRRGQNQCIAPGAGREYSLGGSHAGAGEAKGRNRR